MGREQKRSLASQATQAQLSEEDEVSIVDEVPATSIAKAKPSTRGVKSLGQAQKNRASIQVTQENNYNPWCSRYCPQSTRRRNHGIGPEEAERDEEDEEEIYSSEKENLSENQLVRIT